jgi:hypothetical protein
LRELGDRNAALQAAFRGQRKTWAVAPREDDSVLSKAVAEAPHPVPLPIRWGEGGRRSGEGLAENPAAMTLFKSLSRGREIFLNTFSRFGPRDG